MIRLQGWWHWVASQFKGLLKRFGVLMAGEDTTSDVDSGTDTGSATISGTGFVFPPELQAQFDTAEASLTAAKQADAVSASADSALSAAQASADAAKADSIAKHQTAVADAGAFVDAIKAHFGL